MREKKKSWRMFVRSCLLEITEGSGKSGQDRNRGFESHDLLRTEGDTAHKERKKR